MRLALLVTIFCGFLGVAQVYAKPISVKGLEIFVGLTVTDPKLAKKVDVAMAESFKWMGANLQDPATFESLRQILKSESLKISTLALFSPADTKYQTIVILRELYRQDQEAQRQEQLARKSERQERMQDLGQLHTNILQLRWTHNLALVSEIFSLLPSDEEQLKKVSAKSQGTKEVQAWRKAIEEMIVYTHSENKPLRLAVSEAFNQIARRENFKSERTRFQWKEYFNDVWAEVHPSNTSHIRSCLRVLSGQ